MVDNISQSVAVVCGQSEASSEVRGDVQRVVFMEK